MQIKKVVQLHYNLGATEIKKNKYYYKKFKIFKTNNQITVSKENLIDEIKKLSEKIINN